jgi:hypothetical protein
MTVTAMQRELNALIGILSEDDAEKVLSYAAFLKYLQTLEDEEDSAAYFERRDEPSFSLEEVKQALL